MMIQYQLTPRPLVAVEREEMKWWILVKYIGQFHSSLEWIVWLKQFEFKMIITALNAILEALN